jgi:hypothetical protein
LVIGSGIMGNYPEVAPTLLAEIYWPTVRIMLIGVFVILSITYLLTKPAIWQRITKQKVIKVGQVILAIIVFGLAGYYFRAFYNNITLYNMDDLVIWGIIVVTLTVISRIYKLIENYKEKKQKRTSIIPYIIGIVIVYMAARVPHVTDEVGIPWPKYIFRICVAGLLISGVVYVAVKIYKEVKKGKTLKDISFGAILAGTTFLVLFISGVFLSVPWFPQPIVLLPITMFYLGKLIEDVNRDTIKLRESPFFKLAVSSILLTILALANIFISIIYLRPLVAESLVARFFAHYFNDLCSTGLFVLFTPALAGYLRAMIKGDIEGRTADKAKAILSKKLSKHKIGKGVINYISKRRKDWIRAVGLATAISVILNISRAIFPSVSSGILVALFGWAVWWAAGVIVNMILKENACVKVQALTLKIIPADYSQKLSSSILRLIGTILFWAIGLSIVCEGIGFSSTPDIFDAVAYFVGGGLFVLLWKILGVSFWQV